MTGSAGSPPAHLLDFDLPEPVVFECDRLPPDPADVVAGLREIGAVEEIKLA